MKNSLNALLLAVLGPFILPLAAKRVAVRVRAQQKERLPWRE